MSLSHHLVHWKWCKSLISISEESIYVEIRLWSAFLTDWDVDTAMYSPISVRCIIQLSIPVSTSANGFSLITSNRLLKHSNGLAVFISASRLPEFFVRRFHELIFGVFTEYFNDITLIRDYLDYFNYWPDFEIVRCLMEFKIGRFDEVWIADIVEF